MGFNHSTEHLNGTAQHMANERIDATKKKSEGTKENPYIKEYNKKVAQFHELIEWFEKEHPKDEIMLENITKIKDAALLIQPLPNTK